MRHFRPPALRLRARRCTTQGAGATERADAARTTTSRRRWAGPLSALLLQLLAGLSAASSLFLVAAGLTVIFGVTRVVNFSHGSLAMLGAYIGWSVLTRLPREPAWFALGVLATAALTGLIGLAIEVAVLRRVYRSPELFQLLATFGIVLIVQDAVQYAWGPADLPLPRPRWLRSTVDLLGGRTPVFDLALIAAGPIVLAGLTLLFNRTRWGTLVRAATLDREMAGALGVDQRMLFTTVFTLGAALAGLGGALSLPSGSANGGIDLNVVADAFVVVVVGGLGSVAGAYLASVLIAVLQAFGVLLLPEATLVLPFAAMLAVLAARPSGLLGRPQAAPRALREPGVIRPAPAALVWAAAAGAIVLATAPFWAGAFGLAVLTEALVAILFAASLHLVAGPGGMPSFGHAAWFGIGAYAVALLARSAAAPMAAALPLAVLAAGGAAALFGMFVARLSGVYLAMITLAFAQIVWAVSSQWVGLTGGDNGVLGIRPAAGPAGAYWIALALCLGATLLLRRALYAPLGYALRGARDSAARAEAIGLPTARLRLAAFTLAGAASGLAGGVFTYAKGSAFPTYVSIGRSVDALVMVLLGGLDTVSGPIVGALAYTGLYDGLLRTTDHWRLALGLVIVGLVVAFPEGIAGAVQRLARR